MNEHDEYLRRRDDRKPLPIGWLVLLVACGWAGIILAVRSMG